MEWLYNVSMNSDQCTIFKSSIVVTRSFRTRATESLYTLKKVIRGHHMCFPSSSESKT